MLRAFTDRSWYDVRCTRCQRLLFKKSSAEPLKADEIIEIKCYSCNERSYLVGRPDVMMPPPATSTAQFAC